MSLFQRYCCLLRVINCILLLRESEYEDGDDFVPWPTSPLYAKSSFQCLAAFSQTLEGNSWLHLIPGPDYTRRDRLSSLDVCARACDEDEGCAAATFSYGDYSCWLWRPSSGGSGFSQSGGIAFKTMQSTTYTLSAQMQTTPATTNDGMKRKGEQEPASMTHSETAGASSGSVAAKALGTGLYTFWPGSSAVLALDPSGLSNVAGIVDLQDCLTSCSFKDTCAGVVFGALSGNTTELAKDISGAAAGIKCQEIQGQSETTGLRTVIRAKYDALYPW
eukprot:gene5228-5464_t